MQQKHSGKLVENVKGFDIIECEQCGFRHVNPLPTEEELKDTYAHDYYKTEKPLSITRHNEDKDWLEIQYTDRYETFEEHFDGKRGAILDVGSGPGFFLKFGKERGWNVLGIEPSMQAAAHARSLGVDVVGDFLTPENAGEFGQFDAIHASLVLEHIPNPREFIDIIFCLTKPGGIICLTAPNDYNPFQKALKDADNYAPWWVEPTHHLNYFTPDSLSNLIERCGFDVVLKESTFPIDLFLLMGDNYVGDDTLGRTCHKKRVRFEQTLHKSGQNALKRELYQALAKLNLGREICVYAKRP